MNISVITITHNERRFISNLIKSVLDQSYSNFEFIIVDSNSTDKTFDEIKKFRDKRIKYIRTKKFGKATARNIGVNCSKGQYVFFIDADCVADRMWIKNIMKKFKQSDVVGVEGKTCYVSSYYKPSLKDHVVYNKIGGIYPTCNIAYKKKFIKKVNGFKIKYNNALEDMDIALRMMKFGKIIFADDAVVFHQRKINTFKTFFKELEKSKNLVYLIKDHSKNVYKLTGTQFPNGFMFKRIPYLLCRIASPINFLILFFPPLLFFYFIFAKKRIENLSDIIFIPLYYFRVIMERVIFWRYAIKEKIFLI